MNPQRIEPEAGQESVWDYPRPPKVEDTDRHIRVIFNGITLAETHRAKRVLETSHPPVYYIPPQDIQMQYLQQTGHTTWCEWKGRAGYYTVTVGDHQARNGAWVYLQPVPDYISLKAHVAFYPSQMEACYVDDERVQAQPGDFYGGWVTKEIVGPFKGEIGSRGW